MKGHKAGIKKQLEELWSYGESISKEELIDNNPTLYPELDADQVTKTIEPINETIKDKDIDNKVKQKLNYVRCI